MNQCHMLWQRFFKIIGALVTHLQQQCGGLAVDKGKDACIQVLITGQ